MKTVHYLILTVQMMMSIAGFAKPSDVDTNDPNVKLFRELLDQCGSVEGEKKEACREEARNVAKAVRSAGTPPQCRALRDSSATQTYYACLRQFAGTPQQCRDLRDSNAPTLYYACLKRFADISPKQSTLPEESSLGRASN